VLFYSLCRPNQNLFKHFLLLQVRQWLKKLKLCRVWSSFKLIWAFSPRSEIQDS